MRRVLKSEALKAHVEKEFHNILIVGTAHVLESSVEAVKKAVERWNPTTLAVELCEKRYESLQNPEKWDDTPITDIIRSGKGYLLLAQIILSALQKEMGIRTGSAPGAEMIEAIKTAEEKNLRIELVDRDITVTLKRAWNNMGFFEKMKFVFNILLSLFLVEEDVPVKDEKEDTEEKEGSEKGEKTSLKDELQRMSEDSDLISEMMEELRRIAPSATHTLVDERDAYIALKLAALPPEEKVVAVLGAGHVEGVVKWLERIEKKRKEEEKPCFRSVRHDLDDTVNIDNIDNTDDTQAAHTEHTIHNTSEEVIPNEEGPTSANTGISQDQTPVSYHTYFEPRPGIIALGALMVILSLPGTYNWFLGGGGSWLDGVIKGFSDSFIHILYPSYTAPDNGPLTDGIGGLPDAAGMLVGILLCCMGFLFKKKKRIPDITTFPIHHLTPSYLERLPEKSYPTALILGYGIVGIFIVLFAWAVWKGGTEMALEAFFWWFIINGSLSAIGVALVKAHPYTILTAFFAAPFTSLNPAVAAGWFAALTEAKIRTPTVKDLRGIETLEDIFTNRAARVLLVAAMGNLGSIIGTYVGIAYVAAVITG